MSVDTKAALFMMLGQTAEHAVEHTETVAPDRKLLLSPIFDLAVTVPDKVRMAEEASEAYRLFFVFESYLREFVVEVLSRNPTIPWWDGVPTDVQSEVMKLEETEEVKGWMALGSRDRSALMTLPQLLKVIDHGWKASFEDDVRDRALVQEARLLVHLRNTICHMSPISDEEMDRIRQTMRDGSVRISVLGPG